MSNMVVRCMCGHTLIDINFDIVDNIPFTINPCEKCMDRHGNIRFAEGFDAMGKDVQNYINQEMQR